MDYWSSRCLQDEVETRQAPHGNSEHCHMGGRFLTPVTLRAALVSCTRGTQSPPPCEQDSARGRHSPRAIPLCGAALAGGGEIVRSTDLSAFPKDERDPVADGTALFTTIPRATAMHGALSYRAPPTLLGVPSRFAANLAGGRRSRGASRRGYQCVVTADSVHSSAPVAGASPSSYAAPNTVLDVEPVNGCASNASRSSVLGCARALESVALGCRPVLQGPDQLEVFQRVQHPPPLSSAEWALSDRARE